MPNSETEAVEAGKLFLQSLVNPQPQEYTGAPLDLFDHTALQGLKDIETSPGRCRCRLLVQPRVQNRYGNLHGGCIATIVDCVTSAALVTKGIGAAGVSVSLNVDYLRPMPGGEHVLINTEVVKVGRKIAFLKAELIREKSGEIVATGTHVKYLDIADAAFASLIASKPRISSKL